MPGLLSECKTRRRLSRFTGEKDGAFIVMRNHERTQGVEDRHGATGVALKCASACKQTLTAFAINKDIATTLLS